MDGDKTFKINPNLNFDVPKLVLAPMVRICGLPMRLVALDYGADVVFCEEIIDFKMLQCKRVENKLLDTIDFVWSDGTVVFRTCEREKERLIFQMGTSDATRAVNVAKMIEDCVAGIDVNMGCPKEFSIKGGMGAALMDRPDKIKDILQNLTKSVSKPVSCKTRIKSSWVETFDLLKGIEGTGVSWITLHGRLKDERPRHDNHDDVIAKASKCLKVPLIANGGSNVIKCYEDVAKFSKSTNCPSVMLARCAMWNPSIFSRTGSRPLFEVVVKFLQYSIKYDNHLCNVKYCLQHMMHDQLETDPGRKVLDATSVREICEVFGLAETYDRVTEELEEKKKSMEETSSLPYTIEVDEDGSNVYQMPYKYNKRDFEKVTSKMILYEWCIKNKLPQPIYKTIESSTDRMYRTVVTFQDVKFSSSLWDKSKKFSEQASACICLTMLNQRSFYASAFSSSSDLSPPKVPYSERSMNHGGNKIHHSTSSSPPPSSPSSSSSSSQRLINDDSKKDEVGADPVDVDDSTFPSLKKRKLEENLK